VGLNKVCVSYVICHMSYRGGGFNMYVSYMAYGIWHMAYGIWHMAYGIEGMGLYGI
jgi:hypothetical protein